MNSGISRPVLPAFFYFAGVEDSRTPASILTLHQIIFQGMGWESSFDFHYSRHADMGYLTGKT